MQREIIFCTGVREQIVCVSAQIKRLKVIGIKQNPVIYKTVIAKGGTIELVEGIYAAMRKACCISAILTYGILVVGNSVWVWIAILTGIVDVPEIFCILTPVVFLLR